MSTYRILNVAPQYLLPNGKVNAGGSLTTYETDLSTPKLTWADPDKATPNPTVIPLDSAGRTAVDVWGDGEYGVVMKDAAGATIWTRNNVRPGGDAGQTIPALAPGGFLTNDGSNMSWAQVLQVPDPTGTEGYMLYSDGEEAYWGPAPTIPEPPESDIVIGASSVTLGDGTSKLMIQMGTDTAPTSGSRTTSKNITFPTPFAKILYVAATANVASVGTYGIGATGSVSGYTFGAASTGATVTFNSADDGGGSGYPITNSIPFNWIAIGTVADE